MSIVGQGDLTGQVPESEIPIKLFRSGSQKPWIHAWKQDENHEAGTEAIATMACQHHCLMGRRDHMTDWLAEGGGGTLTLVGTDSL